MGLCAIAQVPRPSGRRIIPRLHKAGVIRIVGWAKLAHNNYPLPIFDLGPGPDVKCPFKPQKPKQYYRRYINRLRQSGELEHRRAAERARKRVKAILKRPPATWFSALPGAHA